MTISKLFLLQLSTTNGEICPWVSCDFVRVDFPFRLSDQPSCCGNPNFNLSCRNQPKTIINFPLSGEFSVLVIDYASKELVISDPKNCMAKRLLEGLYLFDSSFEERYPENYTFFNCSSNVSVGNPAIYILCLSGTNFSVWAIPTTAYNPSNSSLKSCLEMATVSIPIPSLEYRPYDLELIRLTWEEPDCRSSCLSTRTKISLIFALGTPIFFIVLFIINHKVGVYYDQRRQSTMEISSTAAETQLTARTANDLDGSRIEAYPITLLGESCQLPRPKDNSCSICLSEYKAKDKIRTITDCGHYFHDDCIDEWLKRNAACPICRNKLDQESTFTTHPKLSSSSPPTIITEN
ncbi:hypothetical protein PTKIN_Ptkin05aG0070100 [Pterospermum kingtungense]